MVRHRAVDGASGGDEPCRHAHVAGSLNHVVRVHGNAVPAHADARGVAVKVPLRGGCRQHVFHVNVHGREDAGEFIDQRDVDVALYVFDDLGRLSDLELTDVTDILARELAVQLDQRFTHLRIGTTDDSRHGTNTVGGIARIEALRTIGYFDVFADGHVQGFDQRQPCMSRHARIDRGFKHHDGVGTFWNGFKDRFSSSLNVGKVGLEVVRHRCRHGYEDDVAMGNRLSRGGCDVPAFGAGLGDDVVDVRVAGRVVAVLHHVNGALRDVHAPDGKPSIVETNGGRKPHIAQADDADGHVGI